MILFSVINGSRLRQLYRIPRRYYNAGHKNEKKRKRDGKVFSRLLKWKSVEAAGIVSGSKCHFREWYSYRAFSLPLCAWRSTTTCITEGRVQEGQRICMPCYSVYAAYSEMFMRPVQRPITKMTIKINCSHRTARDGLYSCRLIMPADSREYVMRKQSAVRINLRK